MADCANISKWLTIRSLLSIFRSLNFSLLRLLNRFSFSFLFLVNCVLLLANSYIMFFYMFFYGMSSFAFRG